MLLIRHKVVLFFKETDMTGLFRAQVKRYQKKTILQRFELALCALEFFAVLCELSGVLVDMYVGF